MGIGDALRQRGFDEHKIADHYVDVTERLKGKADKSGSVEKLLVDVLRECSKYIEPTKPLRRAGDRLGSSGAPVHVHLLHNVTRPKLPLRAPRRESDGPAVDAEFGTAPDAESCSDSVSGARAQVSAVRDASANKSEDSGSVER
jgi:hypothetical protein